MDYTELIEKLRNDSRLEILDWDNLPMAANAIEALLSQLPEGMKHCAIVFKECDKGHGELTATNWEQHECQQCKIEALQARVKELTAESETFAKSYGLLVAKLEVLEKQAPVVSQFQTIDGIWHPFLDEKHYQNTVEDGRWPIRALYLAPAPAKTLSEEEIESINDSMCGEREFAVSFARAIETALKGGA